MSLLAPLELELPGLSGVGADEERSSTSITGGGTLRSMAAMLSPRDDEAEAEACATPPWRVKGEPPREWSESPEGAVRMALDRAAGSCAGWPERMAVDVGRVVGPFGRGGRLAACPRGILSRWVGLRGARVGPRVAAAESRFDGSAIGA